MCGYPPLRRRCPDVRVSSAAMRSTSLRVRRTLSVMSSRFPIGVAHKYKVPLMDQTFLIFQVIGYAEPFLQEISA